MTMVQPFPSRVTETDWCPFDEVAVLELAPFTLCDETELCALAVPDWLCCTLPEAPVDVAETSSCTHVSSRDPSGR